MDEKNLPVWCSMTCDKCAKEVCGRWVSGEYIPRVSLFEEAKQRGAIFEDTEIHCKECAAGEEA